MILFISFLKSLWAFERRAKGWKLCVFVTAHIKKLKKKLLCANSGIRYKTHVAEICHSAVQKDKACWVPCAVPNVCRACLLEGGEEGFEDAAAASWAAGCALSANLCPPFPFSSLLSVCPEGFTVTPLTTVHGLKTFLIPFPLSSAVIICVEQMLLGYLCLAFQLDALYLSLCVDYTKNISTFSTTNSVKNPCTWQWLYILLPEEVPGVLPAFISCVSCLHLSSFMCCLVCYFLSQWPNFQLDESA